MDSLLYEFKSISFENVESYLNKFTTDSYDCNKTYINFTNIDYNEDSLYKVVLANHIEKMLEKYYFDGISGFGYYLEDNNKKLYLLFDIDVDMYEYYDEINDYDLVSLTDVIFNDDINYPKFINRHSSNRLLRDLLLR